MFDNYFSILMYLYILYKYAYIGRYMNLEAKLLSKKKFRFIKNIIQINSAIILSYNKHFEFDSNLSLIIINYKNNIM